MLRIGPVEFFRDFTVLYRRLRHYYFLRKLARQRELLAYLNGVAHAQAS